MAGTEREDDGQSDGGVIRRMTVVSGNPLGIMAAYARIAELEAALKELYRECAERGMAKLPLCGAMQTARHALRAVK